MRDIYMPAEDRHLYSERMGAYSGSAFSRPSHGLSRSSAPLTRMVLSLAALIGAGAVLLTIIHLFGAR